MTAGKEQLYTTFSRLRSWGFFVLPKKVGEKLPAMAWAKLTRETYDEQAMLTTHTDGWVVLTGERSGNLLVIDLDPAALREGGNSLEAVRDELLAIAPTDLLVSTPSGGLHLYYRTAQERMFRNGTDVLYRGVDVRGEGGLVVAPPSAVTYTGEAAKHKGVEDGFTGYYAFVRDGQPSFLTEELFLRLRDAGLRPAQAGVLDVADVKQAREYSNSLAGNARSVIHAKQTREAQERVVLEALAYVLKDAGRMSYDLWTQVWMSAHSGCANDAVREYIINHPDVFWSDGQAGKDRFRQVWDNHTPREAGYTVASLFWLARQRGWLASTGQEIPHKRIEPIFNIEISEWFESLTDIPRRLALISQTGTGKTQALHKLYAKLGAPRTLVLVPTVKLALELTATLNAGGLSAEAYIDQNTLRSRSLEVLNGAHILVTTLQTFATKVWMNGGMRAYGLVYLEESDQLLAGFSRAAAGRHHSHVRESEAQAGFHALRWLLERSHTVWAVDATMTRLTVELMDAMSPIEVRVVENEYTRRKASVEFVKDYHAALQKIMSALQVDKRVVVVCDTAAKARDVYDLVKNQQDFAEKKSILITRYTEADPDTVAFMNDVNKEAAKYDLVVYNSVMGSGVSVTAVQPDIIVQISTYLTPRANLQLLNRYRLQSKVYCYYQPVDMLYTHTHAEIIEMAMRRAKVDARLIALPVMDRSENAVLRTACGAISIADEYGQRRSARDFYIALLKADGRTVIENWDNSFMSPKLAAAIEKTAEDRELEAEYVTNHWNEVRPIDHENPPDKGMSSLEIACGRRHAMILDVLGEIPAGVPPAVLDKVVREFAKHRFTIEATLDKSATIRRAERKLLSREIALLAYSAELSRQYLLGLLPIVYPTLHSPLKKENLGQFRAELERCKEMYDVVMPPSLQWDKTVDADADESNIRLVRNILGLIGLRQRKKAEEYILSNVDELIQFARWMTRLENPDFALGETHVQQKQVFETFDKLPQQQVARALTWMAEDPLLPFESALQKTGEF